MKRLLLLLVIAAAGCSTASPPETTTSTTLQPVAVTTSAALTTTVAPDTPAATSPVLRLPEALDPEIGVGVIRVDETELVVALADTAALRRQGLMHVDDLLDLDGMLFIFDADNTGGFWMKNTLLPLDIAFFDSDGTILDSFDMEPCTADPCPVYSSGGPYRYALEMVAGTMPADPQKLYQD